jgi:hypothetical protein
MPQKSYPAQQQQKPYIKNKQTNKKQNHCVGMGV